MSDVRDISLAPEGERKIAWAMKNMPLLTSIGEEFERARPFDGIKITLSVHLEAKTACLCRTLALGGAEMHVSGSNPLSTQDAVAAALAEGGMDVHAYHGATDGEYVKHLTAALQCGPHIVIDDGCDLTNLLHTDLRHLLPGVIGGCEETTTGIIRLNAMAKDGVLKYPVMAVNDAKCKRLFDNRYGTGQSVWDAINGTTNLLAAGKTVVVAGYGWCGRGIATRSAGQGARVIVTEIDPVKALEAVMDGHTVMPMAEAAKTGDVFITATSCSSVIDHRHFELLKDGAILTNAGHFNVEVCMAELEAAAVLKYEARDNIVGYKLKNGRTVFVIGEGRLVNLAAGDGHPVEIMDMSFAVQALAAKYVLDNKGELEPGVHKVPDEIDGAVASRRLAVSGISIDSLTEDQEKYLTSWAI